jgi:hypothetical protein
MSSFSSSLLNSPSVKKLAGAPTSGNAVATTQATQAAPTPGSLQSAGSTPVASQASKVAQAAQSPASGLTKDTTMHSTAPKMAPGTTMLAPSAASRALNVVKQGVSAAQKPAAAPGPSATDQTAQNWADPTSYYQQANDAITAQEQTAQKFGGDQIAANQRRAATLAALSGRGLGGGFLEGQNQATIEGINNEQQQINAMEQQRQQIYGQEATQSFQNQQQDKQNAFSLETQTAQNNAAAAAQDLGASKQNAASSAQNSLKALGIDPVSGHGPAWATFAPLYNAVNNATTSAQLQAAQAALNAAIAKLNTLKQQNPKAKGMDWNSIVETADRNGYFTGNGNAYNAPTIPGGQTTNPAPVNPLKG